MSNSPSTIEKRENVSDRKEKQAGQIWSVLSIHGGWDPLGLVSPV